mgnify:CR=1 FL=1
MYCDPYRAVKGLHKVPLFLSYSHDEAQLMRHALLSDSWRSGP